MCTTSCQSHDAPLSPSSVCTRKRTPLVSSNQGGGGVVWDPEIGGCPLFGGQHTRVQMPCRNNINNTMEVGWNVCPATRSVSEGVPYFLPRTTYDSRRSLGDLFRSSVHLCGQRRKLPLASELTEPCPTDVDTETASASILRPTLGKKAEKGVFSRPSLSHHTFGLLPIEQALLQPRSALEHALERGLRRRL